MSERRESRHVRTEDLLPPPSMGKPLALGGAAAIAGAVAWGLIIVYGHMEIGWLAIGIGALIGFAMVKGGAHGTVLAVCAGVLALLSIGSGKNISYRMQLDEGIAPVIESMDEASHREHLKDAEDWVALGDSPTNEQLQTFAEEHHFDVDPAEIAQFAREIGPSLRETAAKKPTLDEWRDTYRDRVFASYTFVDYLKEDFHLFDILFAVLGISAAFGMVSKATMAMQSAERERIRAERKAEEAAAAPEEPAE